MASSFRFFISLITNNKFCTIYEKSVQVVKFTTCPDTFLFLSIRFLILTLFLSCQREQTTIPV